MMVIYSVTLALVAWTCSDKDMIDLYLGISLPLSAHILDHLFLVKKFQTVGVANRTLNH